MNKEQLAKTLKKIVCGELAHTTAIVSKDKKNGWEIKTGVGNIDRDNVAKGEVIFKHDRNSCTIEEIKQEIKKHDDYGDFDL